MSNMVPYEVYCDVRGEALGAGYRDYTYEVLDSGNAAYTCKIQLHFITGDRIKFECFHTDAGWWNKYVGMKFDSSVSDSVYLDRYINERRVHIDRRLPEAIEKLRVVAPDEADGIVLAYPSQGSAYLCPKVNRGVDWVILEPHELENTIKCIFSIQEILHRQGGKLTPISPTYCADLLTRITAIYGEVLLGTMGNEVDIDNVKRIIKEMYKL